MQVRAYPSADVSAAKRAGAGMYGRTGRQGKSASVWFSRMLRKRYGVLSRRINACLPQCANPNAYRAEYEKCGGTGTPAFELIKGRMRQRTAKGKEIFPQGLTFNRQVVAKRLKSVKRARKNGKLSGMNGRCKKVETIGQEEAAPVGGAALWGFFGGSGLPLLFFGRGEARFPKYYTCKTRSGSRPLAFCPPVLYYSVVLCI